MINTYFDRIFCINLDSRSDRWTSVQKELAKAGITNIERFPGVIVSAVPPNSSLSVGEIGALKSHLNVIKIAKERKYASILIVEDDVVFSDTFTQDFKIGFDQLPDDWAMFYLGGNHLSQGKFITKNIIKINNTVAIHAYAVRQTIYDPIIELLEKCNKPVDIYYTEIQAKHPCYCYYPHIAWQQADFSDIQAKETNYEFIKAYKPKITADYILKRPGDAIRRIVEKLKGKFRRAL